jgi:hypothetical protein
MLDRPKYISKLVPKEDFRYEFLGHVLPSASPTTKHGFGHATFFAFRYWVFRDLRDDIGAPFPLPRL